MRPSAAIGTTATLSLPGAVAAYPLFAFGCTLILAALIKAEALLSRSRLRGATLIAALSYSLYLSHKLVMHLDNLIVDADRLQGWMGLLFYFGTSFLAASALYLAVERPFTLAQIFASLHRHKALA